MGLYDIPVSTTTPEKEYESIGIVSHYHIDTMTKQMFGTQLKVDDLLQEIIKVLVKKAKDMDADAIYGLKIDFIIWPGAIAASNNYNVYGTAVKLKK